MWKTITNWQPAFHFNNHREHGRRVRHRHHGFCHPIGLELLERRLALNSMPATMTTGNVPSGTSSTVGTPLTGGSGPSASPSNGQPQQNGLSPLPGPTTSDTNPSNPIEGQSTAASAGAPLLGTFQNAMAFNNPSFIPQDRPPLPFSMSPGDHLPFDIYQTASTPFGVRNFQIGANTSMAHGGEPTGMRGSRLSALPNPILDDAGLPTIAQMSAIERHAPLPASDTNDIEVASHRSVAAPTLNDIALDEILVEDTVGNAMLVDDMLVDEISVDEISVNGALAEKMAKNRLPSDGNAADSTPPQFASHQADSNPGQERNAWPVAVAASVAVGASVSTQLIERRRQPARDSWPNDANHRLGRRPETLRR